jgi:hypothetical protein
LLEWGGRAAGTAELHSLGDLPTER